MFYEFLEPHAKTLKIDEFAKKCNHYVLLYSKTNKLWHFNHMLKQRSVDLMCDTMGTKDKMDNI